MRVLFVTHNVPRYIGDVAGSFVLRLASALVRQGVQVEIIAPGETGLPAQHVLDGVTIHRVRYASEHRMTLAYEGTMVEQVQRSWGSRFALLGLLRALRRGTRRQLRIAERAGAPFDVVHAHWWFPAGLALWRALPRTTLGRVITMHGSDVRLAARVQPARTLMKTVLQQFDVRTTVSSWLASVVADAAPQLAVDVAPMPVDVMGFQPPALAEHAERSGILFVGRLNAQKGAADLLAALARPELQHVMLDIVGNGPDRDWLVSQAQRSGIAGRIRWHDVIAPGALAPMFQRARVVVMPSRNEGLGLVAVEAQLCATPVVAYASGGLVDVVRAEHGGTLVPVGNIAALAHAVQAVHDDLEEVRRRGAEARAFVASRFDAHAVALQYIGFYQRAVDRRSQGRSQ